MNHKRLVAANSGFTLFELMIIVAILALLMAIAIPNFIAYRNKAYCTAAETDADNVAAAIANYFGMPNRTETPTIDDLKVKTHNLVEIISADPNTHITIQVTELTHRCPFEYQNGHPGWDGNDVFVKEIL
jgi:type IV pilus assembly protein PilA